MNAKIIVRNADDLIRIIRANGFPIGRLLVMNLDESYIMAAWVGFQVVYLGANRDGVVRATSTIKEAIDNLIVIDGEMQFVYTS